MHLPNSVRRRRRKVIVTKKANTISLEIASVLNHDINLILQKLYDYPSSFRRLKKKNQVNVES